MNEVNIIAPYPISLNKYLRIFQNRTYRTKEANEYKANCLLLAKQAGVLEPFNEFVVVEIELYPKLTDTGTKLAKKDSLWMFKVQSIDVDNSLKVLIDSFNKVIYTDDKKIVSLTIKKCIPYCAEGAVHMKVKKYV